MAIEFPVVDYFSKMNNMQLQQQEAARQQKLSDLQMRNAEMQGQEGQLRLSELQRQQGVEAGARNLGTAASMGPTQPGGTAPGPENQDRMLFEYYKANDPAKAQQFAQEIAARAKQIEDMGDSDTAVKLMNDVLGAGIKNLGRKGDWNIKELGDGSVIAYNPFTREKQDISGPTQKQPPYVPEGAAVPDGKGGWTVPAPRAAKPATEPRPQVVAPGGVLVSPDGKPIYTNPKAPPAPGGGGMGGTGKPPIGYRFTADGSLEPIPGGPADQKTTEKAKAQEGAVQSISTALEAAKALIAHPGRKSATGMSSITNAIAVPGGAAKTFLNDLETFKSQMFVPMVQSLKGMGQLSDAEGKKLLAAVGNLETTSSEGAFVANLNRVIKNLEDTLNRTGKPIAGGTTGRQPASNKKGKSTKAQSLLNKYRN